MTGAEDLRAAADRLRDAWLDTRVGWRDESAADFETYHWGGLDDEMSKVTEAAAAAMAEVTAAVREAGA